MDYLEIEGGCTLNGKIAISGAKNAALPLLIATILTDKVVTLSNVPDLADIKTLIALLETLGTSVTRTSDNVYDVQTKEITGHIAHYDLVRKMRASIFVLGPLLARNGYAEVSLPGGCAIGTRPVDLHLKAMESLGATITIEDGYIKASTDGGLKAGEIVFDKISVGATENAMMAAAMLDGTTKIRNAAKEPEIIDLGELLIKMGATITGLGQDTIEITGTNGLMNAAEHAVLPDRIETGSYAIAACMTQGKLTLTNTRYDFLQSFWAKLTEAGAKITHDNGGQSDSVTIEMTQRPIAVDMMTEVYPGFPTDLQAQMMVLNTIASGAGMITETIFENRFMHVPELNRLGANINIQGRSALVRGVDTLNGAQVMATDLRASMALVIAGLVAKGKTTVSRVYHLDRGYDDLEGKLNACGATITRHKEA